MRLASYQLLYTAVGPERFELPLHGLKDQYALR